MENNQKVEIIMQTAKKKLAKKDNIVREILDFTKEQTKKIKDIGLLYDIVFNNAYRLEDNDKEILYRYISKNEISNAYETIEDFNSSIKKLISRNIDSLYELKEENERFKNFIEDLSKIEDYKTYENKLNDFYENVLFLEKIINKTQKQIKEKVEEIRKIKNLSSVLLEINTKFDKSSFRYQASTRLNTDFNEATKIGIS